MESNLHLRAIEEVALDDWPEEIVAVLLAEVLDADLDVFEV